MLPHGPGGKFWSRIATLLYNNPNLAQFGTFERRKFGIYLNWSELMSHEIKVLLWHILSPDSPILLGKVKCFFHHQLGNSAFNPISTGLLDWCRTGGGVFSTPLHNSFVFKVRLLKFCTELLWDKMNILR